MCIYFVCVNVGNRRRIELGQTPVKSFSEPQKLHFKITPEIKKDIEEAKHKMNM